MSSSMIVTRQAKDGPRYFVRYRLGGRAFPVRPRRELQDASRRQSHAVTSWLASWQPDEARGDALRTL